jgi:hypothetical protein
LTKLEDDGLAKIFVVGGDAAANFAQEFGFFYERLVLGGVTDLKAEIVQITEVLIVARVW